MPPKRATKVTKTVMKASQRPARPKPATKRKAMTKFAYSAAARRQAVVKAKGKAKAKAKGKAKAKARASLPMEAKASKPTQTTEKEERRLSRLAAGAEEKRRRALEAWEAKDAREAAKAINQVATLEAQERAKDAARRAGERAKQMTLEVTKGRAAYDDPSIAAFREQFRARAREVLGLGPAAATAAAPEAPASPPPSKPQRALGAWKEDDPAEEELLMMGFGVGSA